MSDPRPYMTGRAETGHYKHAFNKALARFRGQEPTDMAARSGTIYDSASGVFKVSSFGRVILVHYPGGEVTFSNSNLLPLAGLRLVTLNYLGRADGTPLSGRPISYRELEDGMVFYNAFRRESIEPLGRLTDKTTANLANAVSELGGTPLGGADMAAVFPALPRFPITVKLWLPDEELPGAANILFDATANNYLHTEDIAVIGGYTAAFLIKEHRIITGKPWRELVL